MVHSSVDPRHVFHTPTHSCAQSTTGAPPVAPVKLHPPITQNESPTSAQIQPNCPLGSAGHPQFSKYKSAIQSPSPASANASGFLLVSLSKTPRLGYGSSPWLSCAEAFPIKASDDPPGARADASPNTRSGQSQHRPPCVRRRAGAGFPLHQSVGHVGQREHAGARLDVHRGAIRLVSGKRALHRFGVPGCFTPQIRRGSVIR
jgi:hypothetical protein